MSEKFDEYCTELERLQGEGALEDLRQRIGKEMKRGEAPARETVWRWRKGKRRPDMKARKAIQKATNNQVKMEDFA